MESYSNQVHVFIKNRNSTRKKLKEVCLVLAKGADGLKEQAGKWEAVAKAAVAQTDRAMAQTEQILAMVPGYVPPDEAGTVH
jgi:hypothetical protein